MNGPLRINLDRSDLVKCLLKLSTNGKPIKDAMIKVWKNLEGN
jgi:hypothetical protein